jgi:hypothetical protein
MKLSSVNNEVFVISGECPHCGTTAAFPSVNGHFEFMDQLIGVARCISCNDHILATLGRDPRTGDWRYASHYPLGKPDDAVADEIPDVVKPDFKEALRCQWVDAYNATIEMCRRALESSCLQLGADPKLVLSAMIDWVHKEGKITNSLREMAHKIKLGGNRAAHPGLELTKEDADAVIDFTFEYFQHVYVTPARMARHNFNKPEKKGKA